MMKATSVVLAVFALFFALINANTSFTLDTSSAATDYLLVGNAHVDSTSNTFVLTETSPTFQKGAVWAKTLIRLGAGFNITYKFKITHNPSDATPGCRPSSNDGKGATGNADGMVFILNANDLATHNLGTAGENIGYNFVNNFAIEMDTYQNNAQHDPLSFHVAMQSCGSALNSADHTGACKVAPPASITSCYDNVFHTVTITYIATTHNIRVIYDGATILEATYNIGSQLNLINGDSVYPGFTSSTGNQVSRHEFVGIEYHDLDLITCAAGQIINYTDNSCQNCPPGYSVVGNTCVAPPTTTAPTASPITNPCGIATATCSAPAVTVETSDSFQTALSTGSCNIVVKPGTYGPPSNHQGFQITTPGTVIHAEGVVIDCGATGSQTTVQGQATTLTIGLYVNTVNVQVTGVTIVNCQAAVYADMCSSSSFSNATTSNNNNNVGVGAGFHTIDKSVISITGSVITNNLGYAGVFVHGAARITNSNINDNSGGGIIARYSASVFVNGGTINHNYGSGIYSERSSTIGVQGAEIKSNYGSYSGGGIWAESGSTVNVASTTISANSARAGGGIFARNSAVTLVGTTVTGNTATVAATPDVDIDASVTYSSS